MAQLFVLYFSKCSASLRPHWSLVSAECLGNLCWRCGGFYVDEENNETQEGSDLGDDPVSHLYPCPQLWGRNRKRNRVLDCFSFAAGHFNPKPLSLHALLVRPWGLTHLRSDIYSSLWRFLFCSFYLNCLFSYVVFNQTFTRLSAHARVLEETETKNVQCLIIRDNVHFRPRTSERRFR